MDVLTLMAGRELEIKVKSERGVWGLDVGPPGQVPGPGAGNRWGWVGAWLLSGWGCAAALG